MANNQLADFRNFVFLVWRHLGLPDPTPAQYDVADWLQRGPRRSITEAFRGIGKSYLCSAYVAWMLYWDPDLAIMVVSASKQRADEFTTFTLRIIKEMPMLAHLAPREGQRESKISFDVGPAQAKHSPSVKSVGITGQLTGGRADVIVADDIEVPSNSATQMMRDKLSEAVKEFDAVLKPRGFIRYLGTPQTEQSLYNALAERGYQIRIWPVQYPDEKQLAMYGDRLAPWIRESIDENPKLIGEPTDPQRFDKDEIAERYASYGRIGFALQFMLDTRLADADRYPLKLHDLVVMDLHPYYAPPKVIWCNDPDRKIEGVPNVGFSGDAFYRPLGVSDGNEWLEYQGGVLAIDPSGRGKDETGYSVTKMLHSTIFVTEVGGFRGGYDERTLEKLAQVAADNNVRAVIIEDNFGDGMFTQLFKPYLRKYHDCAIEDYKATNKMNKEARIIDTLEPAMMQHRVVIDKQIIEKDQRANSDLTYEEALQYQLFYQMTRLTHEKGALRHDDRLDALSMGVGYWVEQMARDRDEAEETAREARFDKELERFMENVIGSSKPSQPNWIY